MQNGDALFVYGTLRPKASTRMSVWLGRAAVHYERARISGALYHLGRYPGMIRGGSGWVHGEVVKLRDTRSILAILDEYEGGEFRRVRARAITRSGCIRCWVYVYSGPRVAARRIITGDYLRPVADNESLDGSSNRLPRPSAYGSLRYVRRSAL